MPATVRTSGTPTRRKTTSAERGLPGSPISGTPPQSASSVGLPGLSASPWQTISPSRAATVAVRSRAPTEEPAETTTTSSSATRLAEHALELRPRRPGRSRAGPARRRPRARARPARARRRRAPGRARASAVAGGTTSSPVETIADARALRARRARSRRPRPAARGRRRAAAGRPARGRRPGGPPRPGCSTPSPGATPRSSSTWPGIGSVVCSTITTASAPCGSRPPVGIAIAAPGPDLAVRGTRPSTTAPASSRNAGSVSAAA